MPSSAKSGAGSPAHFMIPAKGVCNHVNHYHQEAIQQSHLQDRGLPAAPSPWSLGKVAELANASAMVRYGDTTVLVAVTAAPRPRDGVDFFPLSVDFEEKLYAVGRIPGSFMRREGQPSLPAVLASRLVIDRPSAPVPLRLPQRRGGHLHRHERGPGLLPEVAAMIGVSACLAVSNIPWAGPIGCLEVGYVDGQIVMNPNQEQRTTSQLDLTVAATAEKVVMIEAGADEIPDEIMYDAIVKAHEEIKKQVAFINPIVAEIGKPKMMTSTTPSSTRSCSTRSWPPPWTRPRPPWTPTTRMSGRAAGTP